MPAMPLRSSHGQHHIILKLTQGTSITSSHDFTTGNANRGSKHFKKQEGWREARPAQKVAGTMKLLSAKRNNHPRKMKNEA